MPRLSDISDPLGSALKNSLETGEEVQLALTLGPRRALAFCDTRLLLAHRGFRRPRVQAIRYERIDYVLDRRSSFELFADRAAIRLVLQIPPEHFGAVGALLHDKVERVTEPTSWLYRMVDAMRDRRR